MGKKKSKKQPKQEKQGEAKDTKETKGTPEATENEFVFTAESAIACCLAWLVPGAGHLYLAKIGRAIIFFVCITSLLIVGIALHGKIYRPQADQYLTYLATFACLGQGPSSVLVLFHPVKGDICSATFEYGTTFILAAGLLNMLIILDAFDIAIRRKR
ncbi:DUF6677 family protein [Acidobacteriota bacterium]